jgi:hypothetical protein
VKWPKLTSMTPAAISKIRTHQSRASNGCAAPYAGRPASHPPRSGNEGVPGCHIRHLLGLGGQDLALDLLGSRVLLLKVWEPIEQTKIVAGDGIPGLLQTSGKSSPSAIPAQMASANSGPKSAGLPVLAISPIFQFCFPVDRLELPVAHKIMSPMG